jgi:hypothetical protein
MGPPGAQKDEKCYDPITLSEFIDKSEKMDGRTPLYYSGDDGVLFVCMHGAGHSAASFAMIAKEITKLNY